jgi:uncharacterized protein (DUF488 family)
MATLFSIGHGQRSTEALASILRGAGVGLLVDVRRFPGSRRYPQFNREALSTALSEEGIRYEWWGEKLGGRRSRSPSSRHPAWREPGFQGFADYMDGPAFRAALSRLEARAAALPLAFLCAETLWWQCHRRLISDALVVDGHEVIHLLREKEQAHHVLPPFLRLDEEGRPVYDRGVTGVLPFGSE